MATVRKKITLTQQQDDWIKAQIRAGEFTNDSGIYTQSYKTRSSQE